MDFPKKQQQCLIPRYLLQYLTSLEYHHLDPAAEWGGSGSTYTAGDGITISDEDVISIDNTVALKTDIPSLTGYATETWVTNQGYVTSTDLAAELLNYAELNDLATVATTGDYDDLLNTPDLSIYELAANAFSGDYNDLTNKPTIPTVPTNVSAFTNDAGYITSSALNDYVTTNTNQDITGKKTFKTNPIDVVGTTKGIQLHSGNNNSTNAKLGFTLYNSTAGSSNNEVGFLEANTYSAASNGHSTLLGYFNTATTTNYSDWNLGFAYNGYNTTKGGVTAYKLVIPNQYNLNNYSTIRYIPIDFTDGTNTVRSDATGVVNISSLLPTVPTNVTAFTNDAGYVTSSSLATELLDYAELSDLATVATTGDYDDLSSKPDLSVYELAADAFSGDYNDLTNKPTIPDAVSGTNDGTNWTSLTIGNATYGLASGSTPSNMVTTDTTQTITGTKTFTGDKRIAFKQASSTNNNTLGFTAYKYNGTEYGNLQIASRNDGGVTSDYVTLGNYSTLTTKARVGFRLQPNFSNSSYNFIMPYGTSNQFESNGYVTYQNTTIPCAFTNGQYVINADETGLVDLSDYITVPLKIEINGTTSGNISFTNGIDFYIVLYKSSAYQRVSELLGTITNPTQDEAIMINMLVQGLRDVIVQYTDGNVDHTHNFVMASCDVDTRIIRLIDDSGVNEILLNFNDITISIMP